MERSLICVLHCILLSLILIYIECISVFTLIRTRKVRVLVTTVKCSSLTVCHSGHTSCAVLVLKLLAQVRNLEMITGSAAYLQQHAPLYGIRYKSQEVMRGCEPAPPIKQATSPRPPSCPPIATSVPKRGTEERVNAPSAVTLRFGTGG